MAPLSRVLSSAITQHWPNTRWAFACRSSFGSRKGLLRSRLCCCSLLAIWQRPGSDLRQQPTPTSRRTSSRAMAATPDPQSWEMVWSLNQASRVSISHRTVIRLRRVVWISWMEYSPLPFQLEVEQTLGVSWGQSWKRGDFRGSTSASIRPRSWLLAPLSTLKSIS